MPARCDAFGLELSGRTDGGAVGAEPVARDGRGELERRDEAARIAAAGAGIVEIGAMLDRVRMMGRPRVTFTPSQMPSIFAATCPWS